MPPNAVRQRLLRIVELAAPPGVKPTLAYLERIVKAKPGTLKDCARRNSMTKAAAARLLEADLSLDDLTADWLQFGRGPGPRKRGALPSGGLASARSGGEATPGGPLAAGEPVVQYGRRREPTPDELYLEWAMGAARNLAQTEADGVKPIALLALVDIVEEIGLAQGFDPARVRRHTRQLRRDIRERHGLRDEDDRSSA